MNERTETVIIALILVAAIIMLPVSVAVLTHGTDPYRIIEGKPVATAAEKAGLVICSETDVTWDLFGDAEGKVYTISDNCDNPSETIRAEVFTFDSADSRNAAIQAFQSNKIGKGKPAGNMIVLGQHLIFIDSSGSSLFERISKKFEGI